MNFTSYRTGGMDEFENQALVPVTQVVEYTFSDLVSNVLRIPIEENEIILSVRHLVTTAFAGGTPALDIGDNDDPDGYIDSTTPDALPGTLYNMVYSAGVAANSRSKGRFYPAENALVVTHAAGLTAGAGTILVEKLVVADHPRKTLSDTYSNMTTRG